jgi:hypothetical protein
MVGLWASQSGAFLQVAGVLTLLLGVPMLITPAGWARALRWRIPADTDLMNYFGRCLGGVVTVLGLFAFAAARNPGAQPFFFSLVLSMVAVNIGVHVYGAVKRIQPLSETIEIAAWAGLLVAGLLFFPG